MAAQFKNKLKAALEKFDLATAENLSDKIREAELTGYATTAQENKLLERLTRCIQVYRRTMASL